jgi:hypothetical protein
MKKSLHRNVLSCAASPLKLSELETSKQICYQVAASPLNSCALLQAEMITVNKLNAQYGLGFNQKSVEAFNSETKHTLHKRFWVNTLGKTLAGKPFQSLILLNKILGSRLGIMANHRNYNATIG